MSDDARGGREGDVMPARTPEECDRLFGDHVNAGDLDALMTLYEPGGSLVQRDGSVATGTTRSAGCSAVSWPGDPRSG
jgi:hypothetical protein